MQIIFELALIFSWSKVQIPNENFKNYEVFCVSISCVLYDLLIVKVALTEKNTNVFLII